MPSLEHSNTARSKATKKAGETAPVALSDSEANADENGDTIMEQSGLADSFGVADETMVGANSEDLEQNSVEERPVNNPAKEKRKGPTRGRKPKESAKSAVNTTKQDGIEGQENAQKRKRPGRPPKAQTQTTDETEEQRPQKKAKNTETNRRVSGPSGDPDLDKVVDNYVNRTGPLKGRSLYILKREAPTDPSTTHTRSGRVSVRPLAYWKNERCVYGDEEAAEGQRYPLSKIKEIIRTEELEPEKKQKRRPRKSKSKKSRHDDSDSDDEQYHDPYEEKGGVLHGYIRKWDNEKQAAMDEEEVLGSHARGFRQVSTNIGRYRLCSVWYRDSGCQRCIIQIRQAS